ncbi:MAG: hypothetical protein ACYDD4_10120 [Acidimicrobiales bacterium]
MGMGSSARARAIAVWSVCVVVVAGFAGVAAAASGGPGNSGPGNSDAQQGCPTNDNAWSYQGAYPGCHNVNIGVQDDQGHTYFEAGTGQVAQHQNLHSATVMVTPNGDGNPYGDPNGTPPCPDVAGNSTPPQPGQQQTDQQCQTATPAAPVSGPGAGASVDTNWQPLPANDCSAENIVLSIPGWAQYVLGLSSSAPCTWAPFTWQGLSTPLTDNPSEDGSPFDPTAGLSSVSSWPSSLQPAWNLPGGAPTVAPWTSTGNVDMNCASIGPVTGPCALDLLAGGQLYGVGDDNLNTGEHDGTDGQFSSGNTYDGSPDGGGMYLAWQPVAGAQSVANWPAYLAAALSSGSAAPLAPIAENPMPFASFGIGLGFDGPYVGVYTNQETVYHGGGGTNSSSSSQRDAYNYQEPNGSSKDWAPSSCSNGSAAAEQNCNTNPGSNGTTPPCTGGGGPNDPTCGANYYQQQEASNVTSEPGVMVYNNPDPQSNGSGGTPGAYVGTCGAVIPTGAMGLPAQNASPLGYTNAGGQFVAADPTGC